MRWLRFAVFLIAVTVIQAGLIERLGVTSLSIKPNLHLIILVFFAIYSTPSEAIITSFVIGFMADIVAGPMGSHTIAYGIIGTAISYLHALVAMRFWLYQAIAIFVCGLLAGFLGYMLSRLKGLSSENAAAVIFWTSVYSAVIGPLLFRPFIWWMRIKSHRMSKYR
ncbi:MAG: rod shape-determining protein MreD [Phycisphaerae bacterium]|nr:rod shape-determining protein MreD [Phycisphaerae bacterium]